MQIRVIYDPILRQAVAPVTVFDATLRTEAENMLKIMHQHSGIGLAANQVGLNKRLLVTEYATTDPEDDMPAIPRTAICNPRVLKQSSQTDFFDEGCLSLPGLELPVERSKAVVIEAQNLRGDKVVIKAKGMYARVLQHEIDHLNGVLFTDHVANYNDVARYHFAKIVFFGSDTFSLPILEKLVESSFQVVAVVCESDKRAGRGDETAVSPVKTFALKQGIAVFSPKEAKEITSLLQQLKPDLLVLASYGKILPASALAVPVYGCLNVHPSLLPKYRGATPLQTAILNGDKETGVTLMTMVAQVDAGGIVKQAKISLDSSETTQSLKTKLAALGAELLIAQLPAYLAGQATIQAQDPSQVTATKKLTKEMGEIDWTKSALEIDRIIRAYNPWPGSYTTLGTKRLKVLAAHIEADQLQLDEVQLEGKNPTNWPDFVRGYQQQLTKEAWYAKINR